MSDCMTFPDTVEEFMEQYKIVDTEQVYTNGTELVPIFRMKQWFKHLSSAQTEAPDTNAGDTIDRQAAIDEIDEWIKAFRENGHKESAADACLIQDGIIQLPSAQPEQRWIPCSERLPVIKEHHVSEPCIVYCSNGAYGFAGLEENIFGQVGWNCERDDEYHEPLGEVLAWMPLPEPYRGDRNEQVN